MSAATTVAYGTKTGHWTTFSESDSSGNWSDIRTW